MAEEHENSGPASAPAPESAPVVPVTAGEGGPIVGSAEVHEDGTATIELDPDVEIGELIAGVVPVGELIAGEGEPVELAGTVPAAQPRWRVGIDGLQLVTHRDASGLDHDGPGPGRKQVHGDRVVIAAPDQAAAREQFQRRFGVRSSVKPIKVTSA